MSGQQPSADVCVGAGDGRRAHAPASAGQGQRGGEDVVAQNSPWQRVESQAPHGVRGRAKEGRVSRSRRREGWEEGVTSSLMAVRATGGGVSEVMVLADGSGGGSLCG